MSKIDVFKLVLYHSKQLQLRIPDSLNPRCILDLLTSLMISIKAKQLPGQVSESKVLDLKTLPIFSPLKRGVNTMPRHVFMPSIILLTRLNSNA